MSGTNYKRIFFALQSIGSFLIYNRTGKPKLEQSWRGSGEEPAAKLIYAAIIAHGTNIGLHGMAYSSEASLLFLISITHKYLFNRLLIINDLKYEKMDF